MSNTIVVGTEDCEPGTLSGAIKDAFLALIPVDQQSLVETVAKRIGFAVASGWVSNVVDSIDDANYLLVSGGEIVGGLGGGGAGAPADAQYLVAASNGTLSAERVATNSATVVWSFAVAGQASASVPAASTIAAGVVELATSVEVTAGLAVQASDTRLSDARTPLAHKTSHENGGSDELSVVGLSGLLADAQTPLTHKTSHENGGSDELSVAGLSGLLADGQTPLAHAASHMSAGSDPIRIDELKIGTDVTTLNSTTTEHGLLPKLDASSGKFLGGGSGGWIALASPGVYASEAIEFSLAVTSGVAFTVFETAVLPEGFAGSIVWEYFAYGGSAASSATGHTVGARANLRRLTAGVLNITDVGTVSNLGEGTGWTPTNAINANAVRVQLTLTVTTTMFIRGWYRIYGTVLA